ncbi:MAG: Bug family tripartite tricarboxylate transporter substrate binding protein [Beijerinckiaceae bacterium]
MSKITRFAAIAALAAGFLPAGQAAAQDEAAFYKGKTIRIMSGFPTGGSYDLYARLAADMLKKGIPGLDAVIVENKPGGGGLIATSYFYSQSAKDGTALGVLPDTIANFQLMDPKKAPWDVRKLNYIGSMTPINSLILRRGDTPAKTIDDMRKQETIVAASGKSAQSYQFPAAAKVLAGFNFKIVPGYRGAGGIKLALERKEAQVGGLGWTAWRVSHVDRIAKGEYVPVFQIGLKRDAELPNVPLLQELVTDPDNKKAIEFISGGTAIGRALTAPPGVPEKRIAYLRSVFDKVVKDPEIMAIARKRGLILNPVPGKEIQAISDAIVQTPKAIVDKAAKAFE